MTDWSIVAFEGDNVTVEYEKDGTPQRLNFNVSASIDPALNPRDIPAPVHRELVKGHPIATMGTLYTFVKGDILPPHKHNAMALHDIRVLSGEVLVRKDSGDVLAKAGDVITVAIEETHSIEAVEDAQTLHVLLRQING